LRQVVRLQKQMIPNENTTYQSRPEKHTYNTSNSRYGIFRSKIENVQLELEGPVVAAHHQLELH
jgi:hypothetical protein